MLLFLTVVFNQQIVNVQLPKDDRQDRMKGFGYIEFKDKSNLLAALNEGVLVRKLVTKLFETTTLFSAFATQNSPFIIILQTHNRCYMTQLF